jgi:alkanesulfonate monooxygenase SsuD/methylene tetrahydromethanopterin reductase-like flavin-dependent oxidoreductase (luciferase family)
VSFRLYAHVELAAPDIVAELVAQARLAVAAGFDGTMVSEHHNGFAGYLPNPIQAAGWVLESTDRGWAAPCPLLLPLRPTALVTEELAWLAARFPGRVAAGVAAGSLEEDFAVMGTTRDALAGRFAAALGELRLALQGQEPGSLADDPAVARCRDHPLPLVSAAMSQAAVRRAAANGVGLLFDSLTDVARCRELVDAYESAGGEGPVVLVRRAWVGHPPATLHDRQTDVYRSYAGRAATAHWDEDAMVVGDSGTVSGRLTEQAQSARADSLNIRVHVPGVEPHTARAQIEQMGAVRAALAEQWSGSGPATLRRR